ncbi:tumor protein p53-inducible nuclear protein 2-like isoform X1 [Anguilla anguilla]|uniref:tumor protein p53-inducible nuclear protein 2-like isoform X1 n=1 Tax=Anguilla anguilla TaxID=7936 RepID=UPI0015A93C7F|nr:tumor protein p53-inducible nuclear protein 2-like isoform X1 [Anguilla anguilla]
MFQRISSLFFGEVEDSSKDFKGPKPSILEADEEGWLLVSMPGERVGPEGATITDTSPLEDILVELPSLSIYGSHGDQAATKEGVANLTSSVRVIEQPLPKVRSRVLGRVTHGTTSQLGALAKVTQVGRVQRAKARSDRRHLGRNRGQRQNAARNQPPRCAGRGHGTFLHQPGLRTCNH